LSNALPQAKKRGGITAAEIAIRLELIGMLPIVADYETASRAWREVLTLARSQRLTTYDAAYPELANRRGAPLATRDGELIAAARNLGVIALP
jgi:predicted nucleic acid-binding protein